MKRRLWAALLSLVLVLPLLPTATLATGSDFNIKNGLLEKYTGPGGDVVIPESVTAIGSSAFINRTDLTSVIIPDSVTTIGDWAFCDCTSLTTVVIPEGIANIGHDAFRKTPWLEGLGEFAIVQNILLKYQGQGGDVTIPDGVTSIGPGAFLDCTRLTGVTIPSSVTSIGWNAFGGCTDLTAVTIPNSVTSMESYAFSKCTNLTDITLSNNLTSIQNCAFWFCSSLTNVTIPPSVTSIEDHAFYGCTALTNVTIPNSVATIGADAFHDCASLACVTIPDGVTSIGENAFWACSSLTDVTIPASVTEINSHSFYDCGNLRTVKIYSKEARFGRGVFFVDFYHISPDLVVYGYAGSSAQTFCQEGNIPFALLEGTAVPVTGVTLSKTRLELKEGKTATLTATVKPSNADNKEVYWTSEDTKIVTVDRNSGKLTGVKAGKANVTVTTKDGGFTATCAVTVTKATSSVGGGGGGGGSNSGGGGGSSSGGGGGGATPPVTDQTPVEVSKPASENFSDVVKDSWYESGVAYVVQKNLFKGVADKAFAPEQNMTRAMLMTVLARLDGKDTDDGDTWYAKGRAWAVENGISDGTILESSVTREQLVTMLYRYAKPAAAKGDLSAFADGADVSAWAREAMAWAAEQGILTGKDGKRLDPQGTATRAEVATILQRFVEKK